MKKLVYNYLTSVGASADKALNEIINAINNNPSELQKFKNEIATSNQSNNHIAAIMKIMKALNFVPQASSPRNLPLHVYRGSGSSPSQLLMQDGFKATGTSKNIAIHQMYTGASIFVSTSKSLNIAIEHACQHPIKWVYQISSDNGICVNEFLFPAKIHSIEEEVVFANQIPFSQIKKVAIASDWDTLATDFLLISQHNEISQELKRLGLL